MREKRKRDIGVAVTWMVCLAFVAGLTPMPALAESDTAPAITAARGMMVGTVSESVSSTAAAPRINYSPSPIGQEAVFWPIPSKEIAGATFDYTWEESADGTTWNVVSENPTYRTITTEERIGHLFRVTLSSDMTDEATGKKLKDTSDPVPMKEGWGISLVFDPPLAGDVATFSVKFAGFPSGFDFGSLDYIWELSIDGCETWQLLAPQYQGKPTLTIQTDPINESDSKADVTSVYIRCRVVGEALQPVTESTAEIAGPQMLTVRAPENPKKDEREENGSNNGGESASDGNGTKTPASDNGSSRKATVAKKANELKVKAVKGTHKVKRGVKTTIKAEKAFKVAKNTSKGKVTYELLTVPKKAKGKIKVSPSGKITVKKTLKKGTYKITVKAKSKATKKYKSATAKVSLKIKVVSPKLERLLTVQSNDYGQGDLNYAIASKCCD